MSTARSQQPRKGPLRASVIVLSYNSRRYLQACLGSILPELGAQDELIVVDNHSTDGSARFVRNHYPQVKLLLNENLGYAGGNNLGAAAARGELLVFLNPDTTLQPGALSELLKPLLEKTDIALTTACILEMSQPERINTCGNTVHYTGLTYCRGAGQPKSRYAVSTEVDAVSGAAFAIRRSVFQTLDGFDENFFMYVEDTDLSWRARMAGYRCLYVAGAVVYHDYSPAYSPAKAYYVDRNRHMMLLKNLSWKTYLRMLPGILIGELVTWGFLLLKGPRYWGVKPRVYYGLWAQRKSIRNARQAARSHRRLPDRELVRTLTHRLEFEQLAGDRLARLARFLFHPAFRAARRLFAGGRP